MIGCFDMATRYEVEKFDWYNSFSLWRMKMRALLVQQRLTKALMENKKLPTMMKEDEREELDLKAFNAIQLCLVDEVLRNVLEEESTAGL